MVATPSSRDGHESALAAPLGHADADMHGLQLHQGMQQLQLARELDVRAAFSGLPRVNAHWTHRYTREGVLETEGDWTAMVDKSVLKKVCLTSTILLRGRYMKILVVGESGIGKSTFIRNLFASYAPDPNFHVNDVPQDQERKVGLRLRGDVLGGG